VDFLQDADQILILDNGQIAHQGTFDDLCDSVEILKHQQSRESALASEDSVDEIEQKLPTLRRQDTEAEETENLTRRMGDSSLYAYYFKSIGWKLGLGALFFSTSEQFLAQFAREWSLAKCYLFFPQLTRLLMDILANC
jgi:galactitol-specific phosphotransferase system IIC component